MLLHFAKIIEYVLEMLLAAGFRLMCTYTLNIMVNALCKYGKIRLYQKWQRRGFVQMLHIIHWSIPTVSILAFEHKSYVGK